MFGNFVEEYRNGRSPSAIVLDLEFGNDAIFMAGACDFFTGKKIFEIWLDKSYTGARFATLDETPQEHVPNVEKLLIRKHFDTLRKERGEVDALSAEEFTGLLEEMDIGPSTYMST